MVAERGVSVGIVRIEDQVEISSGADKVWALTIDVERWPELTSTITSVERLDEGPLRVGSTARIVQPKQPPRVWTVTRLDPLRRFEWHTRARSVTMTGIHLIDTVAGGCRNTLVLELTGLGSGLLGRLAKRPLAAALRTENDGFKRAAESAG